MAKKKHERRLSTLIGQMREIPDRVAAVLSIVDDVKMLIGLIKEDHPKLKTVAELIERGSLARAIEAMADDSN